MIVFDVMITRVIAVSPHTALAQAIRLMLDHDVSGLPVINEDGSLAGILTEGDLLRRVETGTASDRPGWLESLFRPGHEAETYVASHGRHVGQVMKTDVISVTENATLPEVAKLMRQHGIKRVPVLRGNQLIGIVSRRDLMRVVGEELSRLPRAGDDATIERNILAEMAREPWAGRYAASVLVKDGKVDLDGCIFDLAARDALTVLCENVPGVAEVHNRLFCVEPLSGAVVYQPTPEDRVSC